MNFPFIKQKASTTIEYLILQFTILYMQHGYTRKNKAILFILCVLSLMGCVEEFEADSIKFEKLLVVDGNISDQQKEHAIKLTYTSPIDDQTDVSNAASGAAVWVEDNIGDRTDFIEQSTPGLYLSPADFAGIPGRSYALYITTSEGDSYKSTFQTLTPAPEISRIYNRYSVDTGDGKSTSTPGFQFFIDVDNTLSSSQFFRYEWSDAHQIIVPYIKKYKAEIQPNGSYTITDFDEDVKECYREDHFQEIILQTSSNNEGGSLQEVPIRFTASSEFDVTTKYSIEVTQRAISPEAYSYYRKLELFNESNGSLFDRQQGVVVGNLQSVNNPDEKVLGYFEVSGTTSKRVFLALTDLDPKGFEHVYRTCNEHGIIEFEGSLDEFYNATDVPEEERSTAILVRSVYDIFDQLGGLGEIVQQMAHRHCVDCRYNGQLGKPSYWQ